MAKRGYKLQEFVAHTTNVNCLSIAKKACRLFITGDDDHKVNLWAIGKPTSLMSLCGHTSSVESLAFDTAEVLVLSGASAGAIKLWDLEETKLVRSLTGHRSNCTAVEFHPFGEFFASGSTDTNLKIWDIRKKGCMHTYKGHAGGISTIRFTPDGRWIVSGGLDNVVKVWDLTAGKHLHDFKFHDGPIRSIDFHPLEFLLATGSADRTVKFWDLETFELTGSSRPEATGVRAITFNPDGRTLFCGLDDSLKVYSWEPITCHDNINMGWSTLGDLCILDGKLLGCSYNRNSVGVWVADISLIQPYGTVFDPEETDYGEQKLDKPINQSSDRIGSVARPFCSESPSYEPKEIKNIYVDCSSGKTLSSGIAGSLSPPVMIVPLDKKEMYSPTKEKQSPVKVEIWKSGEQALNKSLIVPTVVPRDSPVEKDSTNSKREAITFSRTKPGMLLRPAHVRKPSNSKNDLEKISPAPESVSVSFEKLSPASESVTVDMVHQKESTKDQKLLNQILSDDGSEKPSSISGISDKFEKDLSLERPSSHASSNDSTNGTNRIPSVKIVNGVAVVAGRTRTLVEKFERQEKLSSEDRINSAPQCGSELSRTATAGTYVTPPVGPEQNRTPTVGTDMNPSVAPKLDRTPAVRTNISPPFVLELKKSPPSGTDITPAVPDTKSTIVTMSEVTPHVNAPNTISNMTTPVNIPTTISCTPPRAAVRGTRSSMTSCVNVSSASSTMSFRARVLSIACNMASQVHVSASNMTSPVIVPTPSTHMHSQFRIIPETDMQLPRANIIYPSTTPETDRAPMATSSIAIPIVSEFDSRPHIQREEPEVSGRGFISASYKDISKDLMQSHEVFLSTLKSRLTKLQVVRHFWEQNDMKGAINAMRKLPDHSVQADVVSVLMDKMEIITLDLFSFLLPVLLGLLDSKTERHASLSLEILLKLVAVFGPVIRSTISAHPTVGVDLHAEERRECCNQCYIQLQKIQQLLPTLSGQERWLAGKISPRTESSSSRIIMESVICLTI